MSWNSLYFPCDLNQPLITNLQTTLTGNGYTLYNPFGIMPGRAYADTIRLFVSPVVVGWVRVIGGSDATLLPDVSHEGLCLQLALVGTQATIAVYHQGAVVATESALSDYVRDGCTVDHVRRILSGDFDSRPPLAHSSQPQVMTVPLDALPQDVQTLAGDIDTTKAQKMFERISGNLLNRAGGQAGDDATAARELLTQQDAPDWNSAGGQQLRALMNCLTVGDDWREPDFITLRDAYQLHARRQRKPAARLYPGDAEAMAKVPNALDYTPIYAGKDA